MTSRKKPGVVFWATVGLVVVLVGYPLSLFPILWLESRGMIHNNRFPGNVVWAYCAPVRWLNYNGPSWAKGAIVWMTRVTRN